MYKQSKPNPPGAPDADRFAQRITELRAALMNADPYLLADKTGATYHPIDKARGELHLPMWNRLVVLDFPGLEARYPDNGEVCSSVNLALLLYYFTTADGMFLSGKWISFAELPGGRFYNQAFQGYSGNQLARAFQNDRKRFEDAAERLGGSRQTLGDASFAFQALPRVALMVVFWEGDEDFPDSVQVLFDASASHYLPTDAYAILGSTLTRRLMAATD